MKHLRLACALAFSLLLPTLLAGCGRMGDPIPPGAALLEPPAELEVRGRDGAFILSWAAPTKTLAGALPEVIRGYAVERQVLPPGEDTCSRCPTIPDHVRETETTSLVDRDLTPEHTYRYRVRAIDYRDREGRSSPWVEATWSAPPPAPDILAFGINGGVRLRVGPVKSDRFKPVGFAIYSGEGKLLQRIPAGVTEAQIGGFPNDLPVELVARWEEEDLKGRWVLESLPVRLTVIPRDLTPPEPPGAIAVFPDPTGATLHWLGAAGETVATYLIERAEEGGSWVEAARVPGSQLRFSDTGLVADKVYLYRVSAFDRDSNLSFPSAEVRVKAGRPQ